MLSSADVASLSGFGLRLREFYRSRRPGQLSPDSRTLTLSSPRVIDHVLIQEQIETGQHIARHAVDKWDGSRWVTLIEGTTVGYKRLYYFEEFSTDRLRLRIMESFGPHIVSDFACFSSTE